MNNSQQVIVIHKKNPQKYQTLLMHSLSLGKKKLNSLNMSPCNRLKSAMFLLLSFYSLLFFLISFPSFSLLNH